MWNCYYITHQKQQNNYLFKILVALKYFYQELIICPLLTRLFLKIVLMLLVLDPVCFLVSCMFRVRYVNVDLILFILFLIKKCLQFEEKGSDQILLVP
jgi:hypothetical protein